MGRGQPRKSTTLPVFRTMVPVRPVSGRCKVALLLVSNSASSSSGTRLPSGSSLGTQLGGMREARGLVPSLSPVDRALSVPCSVSRLPQGQTARPVARPSLQRVLCPGLLPSAQCSQV